MKMKTYIGKENKDSVVNLLTVKEGEYAIKNFVTDNYVSENGY